ncbi:hypothetical protein M1M06_22985, partial [Ralstonia insidiosa]|uniref:hypothetical protein n=1 Tax=Ralstonia insidiosa TaxID=190721 RepID=UPI00200B1EBE
LKNCAINFVHRVAAFAAAEKRDYAELFRRCQQLAEEFLSFNALLTYYRDTTRSLLPIGRKPAPPLLLHRPNTTASTFVSALCRAARGEL